MEYAKNYIIENAHGRVFGRYATKEQAMRNLYLLEGTNARLIHGGLCIADAKHLPKRTQCKQTKKGFFSRLFKR